MIKDRTKRFLACAIIFFLGTALIIVSFFLPPMGVIDPSVLEGSGLIFAGGAVFMMLATKGNYKIKFRDWEITRYVDDKPIDEE